MKTVSGKNFCGLLESRGWRLRRIRGSHHIYTKEGIAARISVPVHGNTDLPDNATTLRPNQQTRRGLKGPSAIEREIGEGGMAAVDLADEPI